MGSSRRAAVATMSIAIVVTLSCNAVTGLDDLTVCGSADCLTAASGGDGGVDTDGAPNAGPDAAASPGFTIGGTVSKLTGKGLVLKNGTLDELAIDKDGAYTFPTKLERGAIYSVSVGSQPSDPSQICNVANGSGAVSEANVTNVDVTCSTTAYRIGGVALGKADGVVLTNNGGDDLPLAPDKPFTFPTKVPSGDPFKVAIKTQAKTGICDVSGATGVVGVGDVTTVVVNCETGKFTVGGTIAGLTGGVVVQDNGTNDTTITSNGTFAFSKTLAPTSPYAVTVLTQPAYPPRSQTCTVAKGSGTMGAANVKDVEITCTTNSFPIGGTVSNLKGPSVVLKNISGEAITVTANGPFKFANAVLSGATYDVTVGTPPPGEKCTVKNGNGTVTNGEITDITVECGQDPGVKCAPDVYCATGTYCCFDRRAGRGTCIANGSGCNGDPVTCDSAADCGEGVCCARYNKGNGLLRDTVCQPTAAACAQSANAASELWCDPVLAASPCPAPMTCTGTSSTSGYTKCQ